jgi:ribosomal protein L27
VPTISGDDIGSDPGRIAIKFFDGSNVVTGYIVRQTGTRRYVVSAGGDAEFTVQLVRTMDALSNMGPGQATVEVFPMIGGEIAETPEHAHRIEQFTCFTVEGHKYGWRFDGADQDGEANIARIPHM